MTYRLALASTARWRLVGRLLVAVAWCGACALSPRVSAGVVPAGFEETIRAWGVGDPRALAFLPDGRLLVACGPGQVWLFQGTAKTLAGTVVTDTSGERGLNGLAIDPDFAENGWVWLYYTTTAPFRNRVSRFTLQDGVLVGEAVVLEGPLVTSVVHNAGCLRFGPDKTLYVSMGEDSQGSVTSQDPYDLRGKILRINRDGTPAAGNPYLSGGGDPRVWAIGFRNPFRFNVQPGSPGTTNLFIGDVGASTYEEIDIGIPGGNFGWATVEGMQPPGLPGFVYPIHAYARGTGAAVVGGDHAKPGDFPPEYDGDYFFGDWVRGELYRMRLDASNSPISVETFATGILGPTDIQFGPGGALYYVEENTGQVRRIAAVPGTNQIPVALAAVSPDSGPAPLVSTLDGSSSYDPDGGTLEFAWTPGDGSPVVNEATVQHAYASGVHYAVLAVEDPDGGSDTTPPLRIVSGNERPTVAVTAPADESRYDAGEVVSYSGTSLDAEEGPLPCSRYTWRVLFHHDTHVHPYMGPLQGSCSGTFATADLGESSASTWYEVALSVDDAGAPLGPGAELTGRHSVEIRPNTATMTFATTPVENLQLTLDTQPLATPASVVGVVGFRRLLGAPDQDAGSGHTWRWVSWSDGGANDHEIATPAADTTYTATFGCDVIVPVAGLVSGKNANGSITLSWNPVVDDCLHAAPERYRVYAATTPRPAVPPGAFPTDPIFQLLGVAKATSFAVPSLEDQAYFVVVAVGTDERDGPAEHYGE